LLQRDIALSLDTTLKSIQAVSAKETAEAMFNALNRFISRLDADSPAQSSNHGAFGFQVLRNKSLELGIEPWFDFIVGINGRVIVNTLPSLHNLLTYDSRTILTRCYSHKKSATAQGAQ
jgi:hypothetical protein